MTRSTQGKSRLRWTRTIGFAMLLGLLLNCSGIKETIGPDLVIANNSIVQGEVKWEFSIVPPGYEPEIIQVDIKNNGNRELTVTSFGWEGTQNGSVDLITTVPAMPMTIQPKTSFTVKVRYAPKKAADLDDKTDSVLLLVSNDADFGNLRLRFKVPQSFPKIVVDRKSLQFPGATPTNPKVEKVKVTNEGSRDLFLTDFETAQGTSNEFSVLTSTTETTCQKNTALTAGSSCVISVQYQPADAGADSGTLIIKSNDPNSPQLGITLGSQFNQGRIDVAVEDGLPYIDLISNAQRTVSVRNIGVGGLTINAVKVKYRGSNGTLTEDTGSGFILSPQITTANKKVLGAGESVTITIAPGTPTGTNAELHIDSNDTGQSPYIVPISVGKKTGSLVANVSSLGFTVIHGGSQKRALVLENRGDFNAQITKVTFTGAQFDVSPVFSGTVSLDPGEIHVYEVTYKPVIQSFAKPNLPHSGNLEVDYLNQVDGGNGISLKLTVPLIGEVWETEQALIDAKNKRPVASIGGPYAGFSTCDIINFDASASQSFSSNPFIGYYWALTKKPSGSRAYLQGATTTSSTPSLKPDTQGIYEVQLFVSDTENLFSDTVTTQEFTVNPGGNCN